MRNVLRVAAVLAIFMVVSASAWAQGLLNQVYVSETDGNDVPPCGPIKKPCQTFAFSMTRVTSKGRVIVLNTGEYGAVRITKSVTIEAPPGVNALIQQFVTNPTGGSFGVEIAAGSNDVVTLRGIKVSAPPGSFPSHEVVFTSGAALYIENCVVEGGVLGIDIFPFGFAGDVNVFIRDTVVSNAGDGIRVAKEGSGSVRGTLERCSMEGNGDGLDVRDGAAVSARDCVITRARFHGVVVGSSSVFTTQLTLEGCVINNNNVGIGADNANSVVRVSNSTITDNQKGIDIFVVGVSVLSRGNNTLEANTVNGAFNGVYTAK